MKVPDINADYLAAQGFSPTIVERFYAKVFCCTYDRGCWIWTGYQVKGYGGLGRGTAEDGKDYAHRISWVLHRGPIPPGMHVLHHCDTPLCVRPDHLFLGTCHDNHMDMMAKGRYARKNHHGERNPKHKLTAADVKQIRLLHASGVDERTLAKQFGVVHGTVWFIVRNVTWVNELP